MGKNVVSNVLGDGLAATDRFVREKILSRFNNPILNPLEDGSLVPVTERHIVVSTDSFVVDPPFFPNSNIGELAIAGTVNDILASGGDPRFMTLSLIIGEGFLIKDLDDILDAAQISAGKAGVQVIAGDTKTIFLGQAKSSILINTTGFGFPVLGPQYTFPVSSAQPGDTVIVTGPVGNHGLAVLSVREGLGFESRVFSDVQELKSLIVPLIKQFYPYLHCLRDPSRGGLAGVLMDIALSSRVDLQIDYSLVPIQPEVAFGCEMLGIDPIDLVNEGKMVIVVSKDAVKDVLHYLKDHPLGKDSAAIGHATVSNSGEGQVILQRGSIKKRLIKSEASGIPRLC